MVPCRASLSIARSGGCLGGMSAVVSLTDAGGCPCRGQARDPPGHGDGYWRTAGGCRHGRGTGRTLNPGGGPGIRSRLSGHLRTDAGGDGTPGFFDGAGPLPGKPLPPGMGWTPDGDDLSSGKGRAP